uniref:DNA-directed DNA polymerase n=1 Tax=Tanacetum cinerariifolium TaxID=118510 RepID=A0A6L2LJ43_TANCI|nr:DNA-directed DNA polymerase [Tanacetum cinerariifolium]
MSTRSSARNLFPPLDNPELIIRRRSCTHPTLLSDSEMATEENSDLPVPDLRTMEELCQPSLNGRGGPIAPIAIQAMNFGLKNEIIQQVHNFCQFHGLLGENANKHLDKFLHVTQSTKVNRVTDDAFRLYLFPHSLTHHATAWFDRLPRNSINTFEQMAKMFLGKYFPTSMVTKLINEITNFRQRPGESLFKAWECYKLSIDRCPNHNMLPVTQIDTFYNGLTLRHRDTINPAVEGTFMKRRPKECYDLIENMTAHHNDWDTLAQRSESSSFITSSSDTEITALKAKMAEINKNLMRVLHVNQQVKAVTPNCKTCGGPHSFNDCPAIVGNTQNVYAAGAYQGTLLGNTITNPKEELKGITTRSGTAYQGPTIPTTYSFLPPVVERETEATKETMHLTNNGSTKDVQPSVFQTESPILNYEPVVAPIVEPVASPVSAPKPNQRLLIPYPSRLHDQKLYDKANGQREKFFQIFKDLNFNISFDDALILMPKFGPSIKSLLTNKDKLFELARTLLNEHCSTVLLKKLPEKLGDPGKFLIPCDFSRMAECLALADLDASINLMLLSVLNKLSLPDLSPTCMNLKLTDRLISRSVGVAEDVYVKVGTFHFLADFVVVDFDADPREYSQEVLGFTDVIASGNPTPYYDPIVSTTSPTLTPFRNSDFLLEEVDAFLALEDYPTSPEVDQSYVDTEGDILLLEAFLNNDPSLPPPNQGNYLPQVCKELKICEAKTDKSSIDEPPDVELKDLPPHLEYAFLEDFEPTVQNHRRVNPKIHDVIKNEVLKLLDTGLIYLISYSPWVSPVRCVLKNGGFTVLENEENELIPTRLVTGWRVCINYRKLNEATRKDHFPLHFMDQMLERLEENEYYCFLDGFSGTFQRCIMAIFHDMIEKTMEVFMDDFLVFENYFQTCLSYLEKMLKRCEDTNLCLNWEKSHFMVKKGIVLDHKISKNGIEVDKAKVDVIAKLPNPITIKGIRSFLGHAGFDRRFIQDFSKIDRPITRLLEKDTPFLFSKECVEAFQTLKRKLTEAPILIALDWDLPFELMCDASDFAIGAVLGQCQEKHFRHIHYASKTITKAESNYTTTEKEMLAVVYAFEKFRSYLIMNKIIVYMDHSALKYLFAKKDSKARLLC